MRKIPLLFAPLLVMLGCADQPTGPQAAVQAPAAQLSKTAIGGRHGALGAVYVTSQGLYYDTFVSAETLPPEGRFQKLDNGATDFGPGDPGYLGGRWWVDANGDGVQDAGDMYLLCPLLPPGRATP